MGCSPRPVSLGAPEDIPSLWPESDGLWSSPRAPIDWFALHSMPKDRKPEGKCNSLPALDTWVMRSP